MSDVVVDAPVVDTPAIHEAQRARDDLGRFAPSEVRAVEDDQRIEAAPPVEQAEAAPEAEPQEAAPVLDELEEVEWDGRKYSIPKPLKGGLMMQADYTRKTQEVAEQRRAIERQAQEFQQRAQASEQEIQAQGMLHFIDNEIKQLSAVNWDQFVNENPIEANKQWMRFQGLKDQRATIANDLSQRQSERQQEAERTTRQRLQATQDHAMKIPGWSPEMDLRIIEFAKSKGASEQEIANAMSPYVYDILRLAEIGEQTLKRTASAKPHPAAAAKPTSTVGGRANPGAGKSLADMDMDEYVAARQKMSAA